MVNQAKLKSFRTAPRYKYGYEVPRDHDHAIELDKRAGNTMWQDTTRLEMDQLHDYKTFQDYCSNGRRIQENSGSLGIRCQARWMTQSSNGS